MKKLVFIFVLFLSFQAHAVQPDEILKDINLETRAREISKNVRCLVCQGEDIDQSNAELAADLRKLIRDRLTRGDTDAAVLSFLQESYGDYVLLKPPVKANTYVLWAFPALVFMAGIGFVAARVRRPERR